MKKQIYKILKDLSDGKTDVEDALYLLTKLPYEDLGWAKIDYHRSIRKGIPEAIYGEGKGAEQIVKIAQHMCESGHPILVTRVCPQKASEVLKKAPFLEYNSDARLLHSPIPPPDHADKKVITVPVITAGTSDIPVAEEAAITLELNGIRAKRIFDCGVAGIHRLFDHMDIIQKAPVIIVVAGMDGVLPGLIAGIAPCPVIGVPTSIGYGANFKGVAPLLTMLNTCSQGLCVVNIDNGFGAACVAALICSRIKEFNP